MASATKISLLMAVAVLPAYPAAAEPAPVGTGEPQELKPVTVTAEKVTATEMSTAVAMTVVGGEELERAGAKDTGDIVRLVPNAHMTKAGRHSAVA